MIGKTFCRICGDIIQIKGKPQLDLMEKHFCICMECGQRIKKPRFHLKEYHNSNNEEISCFCDIKCFFQYVKDYKKELLSNTQAHSKEGKA